MRQFAFHLLGMTALVAASSAQAASLQVSPVLIDVQAQSEAASAITLHNGGARPITAQVRIFRWTQVDGEDEFAETNDVAVSPPMIQMRAGADYTVRVVRTSRRPIQGEEAYRLLADEVPDSDSQKAGTVNLVVRHSLPVFFRSPDASAASVQWRVRKAGGRLVTEAVNDGDRRMRVTKLKLGDGSGASANYGDGLVGYVLGRSSAQFTSRGAVKGFGGGKANVSLTADSGPITTTAVIR